MSKRSATSPDACCSAKNKAKDADKELNKINIAINDNGNFETNLMEIGPIDTLPKKNVSYLLKCLLDLPTYLFSDK